MCKFFIKATVLSLIFLELGCSTPFKESTGQIDPGTPSSATQEAQGGEFLPLKTITLPFEHKSTVEQSLENRMEEIELLVPAGPSDGWEVDLGINLLQQKAEKLGLTLENAVALTLSNNLDIQIATLTPGISEQDVIEAEAAFDFVFGASLNSQKTKKPQQQVIVGGVATSTSESSANILDGGASISTLLTGGGSLTISTDVTRTNNQSPGTQLTPNPAWQTIGTLDFTQPLLRSFGETVTLAQIRLKEISHNQNKEDLQETLNVSITSTERAYLELALQWKVLQVKNWLLEQGEQVVNILDLRRSYDTGEADYAQAVATVQQRKADVITQQARVQESSDTLKNLINSEEYSLHSETVIQPIGAIEASPIILSPRQAIVTALENRPDIKKLLLSIKAESIQVDVADNARMPKLDMQAQMAFYGLGGSAGDGYQEVFDTDFINYLAGLSFEVPLGNRAAEAGYTSARLQKMRAIATYKKGIQNATVEVKKYVRNVLTNAELIHANKAYRLAQTENLRALSVEEETMAGLSPTFLNLKLQTQSGLANARIAEFTSIINYNKSIVDLYKSMGTTLVMHQIDLE
ncbi:MAG: TolC family protein [Phycisphaerales bacterium]|nr:TolC family protein [Phycisphaerales bacterium]